jgi:hypothetical protein
MAFRSTLRKLTIARLTVRVVAACVEGLEEREQFTPASLLCCFGKDA